LELLKELASVQKLKAHSIKLKHDMQIEDLKNGIGQNEATEVILESRRRMGEMLQATPPKREMPGV
jgi:hypothetical protein